MGLLSFTKLSAEVWFLCLWYFCGIRVALWSCAFGLHEEKGIRFTLMIKKSECNKRAASGDFTWPLIRCQNVTRVCCMLPAVISLGAGAGSGGSCNLSKQSVGREEERRLLECNCTTVLQLFEFIFPMVPPASLAILQHSSIGNQVNEDLFDFKRWGSKCLEHTPGSQ